MFSKFRFLTLVLFLFSLVSAADAATYVVDRIDDVAGASACTAAVLEETNSVNFTAQ
jgi:hypothetical protein